MATASIGGGDQYPPLSQAVVDPQTGMVTREWARWFLWVGQVSMRANTVPASVIQYDTRANQPDAVDVAIGTLYGVTDEAVVERSNGTTWESFGNW